MNIERFSSLLFIIPAIKAFYVSKLILWKIFTTLLVISSYLCNYSQSVNIKFILFDYITIFLVCCSYINNSIINSILIILLIFEYKKTKHIINVKNITFVLGVLKAIVYTYLYLSKYRIFYYNAIVLSSIFGIFIYKLRELFNKHNIYKYNSVFTYIWHLCVTIILYVSSLTAI